MPRRCQKPSRSQPHPRRLLISRRDRYAKSGSASEFKRWHDTGQIRCQRIELVADITAATPSVQGHQLTMTKGKHQFTSRYLRVCPRPRFRQVGQLVLRGSAGVFDLKHRQRPIGSTWIETPVCLRTTTRHSHGRNVPVSFSFGRE